MTTGTRAIESLDARLIAQLQLNGRMSYSELAARLGVRRATVVERLRALLDNDVLQITAIPSPSRLGYRVAALVGLRVEPGHIEDVVQKVSAYGQIKTTVVTAGRYDVMSFVFCKSSRELDELLRSGLREVEWVRGLDVLYVQEIKKRTYNWLPVNVPGQTYQTLYTFVADAPSDRGAPDEDDIALIVQLQRNGRLTYKELGRLVCLSQSAVRRRVSRLIREEYITVTAVPHWDKTGYNIVAHIGIDVAPNWIDHLCDRLAESPHVNMVAVTTGLFNVLVTFMATSPKDLAQFLKEELPVGHVRGAETFWILEARKREFTWIAREQEATRPVVRALS